MEPTTDRRSAEEIRSHYLVERELADRLRKAPPEERRGLYGVVYDELFRRVPSHPQLVEEHDLEDRRREAQRQVGALERFLGPSVRFLEVGAGDLAVPLEVAPRVRRVFAVEISHELTEGVALPPNVELVISDGVSIDVPPESVDVAFSHQLLEHFHPDDAREHVDNVYHALTAGGVYVCLTPNRLSGPHDVSKDFDEVASGFHLKEYTVGDLARLFGAAGFGQVRALVGGRGSYVLSPPLPVRGYERLLEAVPRGLAGRVARRLPFRALLGVGVVATKDDAQRRATRS